MNGPETVTGPAALAHVEPLTTLSAKLDPAHTALVVVDIQNDFCAEGGMMDNEGRDLSAVQAMAARVAPLIKEARRVGALVVFIRNVYSSEGNKYLSDVWLEQASRRRGESYWKRPVCALGSWEGDFYGDVRPEPGDVVVTKHRFSAFHNTDLELVLRTNGIRTMVMAGVASNVCVETTAREGFVKDFYIAFLEDGSATYDDEMHAATLRTIDAYFGQVVSVDDVLREWSDA